MSADPPPAVDLRLVNRALDRVAELLRADPALADRTAAWMRGDLKGDELMPLKNGVPVRVPAELLARIDLLLPLLREDPELTTTGRVSRSSIVRLAVLRGVEVLERRTAKRTTPGEATPRG